MKRLGAKDHIIEEICSEANLRESIYTVMRGRKRKRTREGKWIMRHPDKVVEILRERIGSGEFRITKINEMMVTDGPKDRHVQYAAHRIEAIGLHAIMNVVEKKIHSRFVKTTAASIKGRGVHYLLNRIRRDMKHDPEGMRYAYKYDIRKFYESIDQDVMMACLRRLFKDKKLLTMLERCVRALPLGLSIGLRSSQGFGNMLLSVYLGHYMKDQAGRRHAYWYCDDGCDHSATKPEAWRVRNETHERVNALKLHIKPNERVFPITEGVDYLGYVIFPDHTRLRKRNKKNAARKLARIVSRKRRQEVIASLYGQCKHADCKNLFLKLTGKTMSEFVKLKDTGIKPKYQDGKKRFRGGEVSLADLLGEEFVVEDFETGVVTRPQKRDYDNEVAKRQKELEAYVAGGMQPPQGFVMPADIPKPLGKYVMSIRRNPGRENETTVKAWTGDKENWSILDQMREQELLGRALCTIKAERCKGYTRYVLC